MKRSKKPELSEEKQNEYIDALVNELITLRAKAGISQSDMAEVIGVSRQTYSSVECKRRKMTWNMYLALLFYFDYNNATHRMIRDIKVYPDEFILAINNGESGPYSGAKGIAGIPESITDKLDEQALRSIRTVVMIEYARCVELSGDEVVKAFDGTSIKQSLPSDKDDVGAVLRRIRAGRKR